MTAKSCPVHDYNVKSYKTVEQTAEHLEIVGTRSHTTEIKIIINHKVTFCTKNI